MKDYGQYGMYTKKGNERMQKLVDDVVFRGKDNQFVKNALNRLSQSKSYPEASDTAVREAVLGEIHRRRTDPLREGYDAEREMYNEQMFERKAAGLDEMDFSEWQRHCARIARMFEEERKAAT